MQWLMASLTMIQMNFEDFQKVELKIGRVNSAERIQESDKLVKLSVDIGELDENGENLPRQIIAGIGRVYSPEDIIGKDIVVVANLEPRQIMGLESRGMLLAAHGENGEPVILTVEKETKPGSKIS